MAAGTTPRSKRRKVWPDDAIALPTRDGQDVGGAQERTMLAFASGAAGIRTVEEINPDGSITRLRTRQGRPTFETDTVRATSGSGDIQLRGFVAQIPGRRAVLFNPYTLEVIKTPYTPAAKLYEVQDFMTETTWYDVVLFDRTTIKVNAKAMPKLGITANHGYEAIPHVINYTVGDQYGNAERNTTEKRVFAVGRYSVTSWGGGGVTETLTPTEPRTESRALTIGQRIDGDTAYLGELYHGADGWDGATEWYFRTAEVQMLLTAAYLVKTSVGANVAMSPADFGAPTTSSGTTSSATTLPATPFGLHGSGIFSVTSYTSTGLGTADIGWVYDGTVDAAFSGTLDVSYDRSTYVGSAGSVVSQSGIDLLYSGLHTVQHEIRSEETHFDAQTLYFPSGANYSMTGPDILEQTFSTLSLSSGYESGTVPPNRGYTSRDVESGTVVGSLVTDVLYVTQAGDFSVAAAGYDLVHVSLARTKRSGPKASVYANTTYYDEFMGDNAHSDGDGMGTSAAYQIRTFGFEYQNSGTDFASQPAGAKAAVDAYLAEMGAAFAEQNFYTNEGIERPNTGGTDDYYHATTPETEEVDASLTWTTKDFILYDPTNEVYITVEGSFTGVDNEATLTVLLKVQTRHHTTTQVMGTFSYTYTEMLVEREIGTSGKYAVPSPQIRAIFAPLYCEQGSFKGAHYVTQAEEDGGIAAFHGFNFVLNLRMYSDFDTCNDDNAGQQVYFVPCNLLEMLYAFVFSTEYGVAEDGTRYPVTYTTRFNEMRDTMFATPVRVAVKDGSATNWTDTLGGDFAAVSTVALYRT